MIRLKGARLLRHHHSFTDNFHLQVISTINDKVPQGFLCYSAGISMSIELKALGISCLSPITSSAISRYVIHFAPTSRSGRPIPLKERGRLPGWYSSKNLSGRTTEYLAKVEEFTSDTSTEHGDQIVKRHSSLRGKNASHPTKIFNFDR